MRYCRSPGSDPRPLIFRIVIFAYAFVSFSLGRAASARAQLTAAATFESQYRLRGVSLSNGQPDLRLALSYDHPSGAYGGVSGVAGETDRQGVQPLGLTVYAGYAAQVPAGFTWDVGASESLLTLYLPVQRASHAPDGSVTTETYTQHYDAEYAEVYAGLSKGDISAHLYVSPNYLHQDLRTAYLDITAVKRPLSWLKLFAHAGALTPIQGTAWPNSEREHFDLGVGAAWELRHGELQLAWSGAAPRVEYPLGYRQAASTVILSLTGFF